MKLVTEKIKTPLRKLNQSTSRCPFIDQILDDLIWATTSHQTTIEIESVWEQTKFKIEIDMTT